MSNSSLFEFDKNKKKILFKVKIKEGRNISIIYESAFSEAEIRSRYPKAEIKQFS